MTLAGDLRMPVRPLCIGLLLAALLGLASVIAVAFPAWHLDAAPGSSWLLPPGLLGLAWAGAIPRPVPEPEPHPQIVITLRVSGPAPGASLG